jgi:hypothetical protein
MSAKRSVLSPEERERTARRGALRTLTRSLSSNSVRMLSSSTPVRRRCDAHTMHVSAHARNDASALQQPSCARRRACTPPGSVTADSMSIASCRALMSSFQRLPAT